MLIQLEGISRIYKMGVEEVRVLDDLYLTIDPGEFVAIMGTSGSGKSTLMNILGCLDRPTTGRYIMDNININNLDENGLARIRNQRLGFIFQSFNLISRMTALKNVEFPLIYRGYPRGRQRIKIAHSALESVGLEDRLYHRPGELSGGQQQRVAIARALVNNPSILLADEPTGNLDSATREEIVKIFIRLNQEGKTIILVTHDEAIANYAKRIVRLKDGKIAGDDKSD